VSNILPFALVNGGAVFIDETNIFLCFGGLGKGSVKCGILNIEKGKVEMVRNMMVEDLILNGMLYMLNIKG